jgi:hypothetical protein
LVAQSDIGFTPAEVPVLAFTVRAELRAQSHLSGTYDRRTGSLRATADSRTCRRPRAALHTLSVRVSCFGGSSRLYTRARDQSA